MNGFDLTRPFRLAYTFTRGFLRGTLSGVGAGGRYGLLAGIVVGMLATAGPLGMGALIAFPIAGALIGIGIGLVAGLIGGTVKGVDRTVNKEKYELERAARQKARSQHQGPRGFQYEEAEEAHRERSDITFDRNRQQNQENERDLKTYWQDRVSGEQGASWSKGM
jgi:hypothetical protein